MKNISTIKPRIKESIKKNKEIFKKELKNFFHWVKGAELVDLDECDTSEDPVRPELDNKFRTSYGRKIYGVKYNVLTGDWNLSQDDDGNYMARFKKI